MALATPLNLLEAGLLLHPSLPINSENHPTAARLARVVRSSEAARPAPLDTAGKNSEVMSSPWRGGAPEAVPLPLSTAVTGPMATHSTRVHLYLALLRSVFVLKEATVVLAEVGELVELMKQASPMLGFDRAAHSACFAWLFLERYSRPGRPSQSLCGPRWRYYGMSPWTPRNPTARC